MYLHNLSKLHGKLRFLPTYQTGLLIRILHLIVHTADVQLYALQISVPIL